VLIEASQCHNEKKRNRGADALYKSLQHQIGDMEVTDLGFGEKED
jgi:hypothetical protein